MRSRKFLSLLVSLVLTFGSIAPAAYAQGTNLPQPTRSAGKFYATSYARWIAHTTTTTAALPGSISVDVGVPTTQGASDARQINVFQNSFLKGGGFAQILVDVGTNQETVTLTASSGCTSPQNQTSAGSTCSVSGTFNNPHGAGALIQSGTMGLQEAINDAALGGGGVVVIDNAWTALGGTNAIITSVSVAANVSIEDDRGLATYWQPVGNTTAIATPATLTAVTALPSTTPVGAFTATNYNMCISYVDVMGQEGPCSTSFVNTGAGATSSFIFSAPAASAGAVGYTIYIGLTGAGSTTLQYKVPLVSQPTVSGAAPVSNGVCTLTTVETITPACAVANTSFNQTGATATVTAITVNTSPIQPQATATSSTTVYIPNPGGRTVYAYAPTTSIGAQGTVPQSLAFTIGAAAATTVPNVAGTINVAPNFMNVVGKKIRICGEMTTTASAATIVDVQFQWDSMGQNTAGKGVLIGDQTVTTTIATTGHAQFCQDFVTTVASASATGGSINHVGGFVTLSGVTTAAAGAGGDAVTPGAVGSLNLAVDARINIIYLHTTATDGAGWTLQNLSVAVL